MPPLQVSPDKSVMLSLRKLAIYLIRASGNGFVMLCTLAYPNRPDMTFLFVSLAALKRV